MDMKTIAAVAAAGVKCPTVFKRNPYVPTNRADTARWVKDLSKYADRYNICMRNGFFKIGLRGNWYVKGTAFRAQKSRHTLCAG